MRLMFAALLVGAMISLTGCQPKAEPVQPGQVWVLTIGRGNPWGESSYTNTVLAVSNGWVRFRTHTRSGRVYEDTMQVAAFAEGDTHRVK